MVITKSGQKPDFITPLKYFITFLNDPFSLAAPFSLLAVNNVSLRVVSLVNSRVSYNFIYHY